MSAILPHQALNQGGSPARATSSDFSSFLFLLFRNGEVCQEEEEEQEVGRWKNFFTRV